MLDALRHGADNVLYEQNRHGLFRNLATGASNIFIPILITRNSLVGTATRLIFNQLSIFLCLPSFSVSISSGNGLSDERGGIESRCRK